MTKSTFDIDALEDTVVRRISHSELIDLYIKAPKFDRIFRVLLENHFMQQQERIGQLFSSTAEERYQVSRNISTSSKQVVAGTNSSISRSYAGILEPDSEPHGEGS